MGVSVCSSTVSVSSKKKWLSVGYVGDRIQSAEDPRNSGGRVRRMIDLVSRQYLSRALNIMHSATAAFLSYNFQCRKGSAAGFGHHSSLPWQVFLRGCFIQLSLGKSAIYQWNFDLLNCGTWLRNLGKVTAGDEDSSFSQPLLFFFNYIKGMEKVNFFIGEKFGIVSI